MNSRRIIDRKGLVERICTDLYDDHKKIFDSLFDTSVTWLKTDGKMLLAIGPSVILSSPPPSSSSSSSSTEKKRSKSGSSNSSFIQRRPKGSSSTRLAALPKIPFISVIKPKYTDVPVPITKAKTLKTAFIPPPPLQSTTTSGITTIPSTPPPKKATDAYTGIQFRIASPGALKQASAKKATTAGLSVKPPQKIQSSPYQQQQQIPIPPPPSQQPYKQAAKGYTNTRIQESPRAASRLRPVRLMDNSSFASPQSTNDSGYKSAFSSVEKKHNNNNLTPIQKKGSDILTADDDSVMAIDGDIGDDENESDPFSGSLSSASFDVSRDSCDDDDDGEGVGASSRSGLSECPFCHKEYTRNQLAPHITMCRHVEQKKLAKKKKNNDTSLSTEINKVHSSTTIITKQQQQQQMIIKTPVKTISKPTAPPPSAGKGYVISDYHDTEEEYDSGEEFQKKKHRVPEWAQEGNLENALKRQESTDPDKIFSCQKSCNLEDIFSPSVLGSTTKIVTVDTSITDDSRKRYGTKRDSSGFWTRDKTTWKEELDYKKQMGYIPSNSIPLPFFK